MGLRPRSALYPGQVAAAAWLCEQRQGTLLDQPGAGKTACTLTALADLGAWPALVVAPARVAKRVWSDEAAEWEHLAGLQVTPLIGEPAERLELLKLDSHVETISYELVPWLSEQVDLNARYRAIVFDEVSRLKKPGGVRFRRIRGHGMEIPVRVGLTGTPTGNHLLGLWGELFMATGDRAFGSAFTTFQSRYFEAVDFHRRDWRIRPGAEPLLFEACRPFVFKMPVGSGAAQIEVRRQQVKLDLPAEAWAVQKTLAKELFVALDGGVDVEALQASTMSTKLRQIAGGAVYGDDGTSWARVHGAKIAALEEHVEEMAGQPLLCFYEFRHERERILEALGSRAQALDDDNLEAWGRGEIEVGLAHPASMGHGINGLQTSCSHALWFSPPWSHDLRRQAIGRLARPGQRAAVVHETDLLCGEVDLRVQAALAAHAGTEQRFFAGVGQQEGPLPSEELARWAAQVARDPRAAVALAELRSRLSEGQKVP